MKIRPALILSLILVMGCRKAGRESEDEARSTTAVPANISVRVAAVSRHDFVREDAASGRTVALELQKVRPPFAGVLTEIHVADGDRVRRGAALGTILATDSAAAASGARQMAVEARTPEAKSEAARAAELARQNSVTATLTSPVDGVVVSHSAGRGDRVTADQEIVTLAAGTAIVFRADLPQASASEIRPGQRARVWLAGNPEPISASVHGILPDASGTGETIPVRLDFASAPRPLAIGLFATARIRVEARQGAAAVPGAAILRDDVTGLSRIATVSAGGLAHWVEIRPGISQDGFTEVLSPALSDDTRVVVSGLVGLPDGAAVSIEK